MREVRIFVHWRSTKLLDTFTFSTFSPYLGQKFVLVIDGAKRLEVDLIEATSLTEKRSGKERSARRSPFSLVFRGPKQPLLPQRIYTFEHAVLGSFEIFIVPIGVDEDGLRYEAVFN
jgi:hypothetical protein